MEKSQAVQQARELASNAKQEEALELLLSFFGTDQRYRHLERKTRHVLAQYKRAERDAMLGVSDASTTQLAYNRITQNILKLTDYLEEGELKPGYLEGEKRQFSWGAMITVALAILLLGGTAWYFLNKGTDEEPTATTACPEFLNKEDFRILLFPFRELNENGLRPHLAIGDRLGKLKDQYGINCGIRFYNIGEDNPNLYPTTTTDATTLGGQCRAQLVIWGSAEQAAGSAIIQTRYHFIDQEKLPLHKLTVQGSSQIDTVTTLSSIASQGTITASIEESIKLLFGIIAHGSGNLPVAKKLLESSQGVQDASAALTRDMVLADIYLNQNDRQKATALYDAVLERHPDYPLALNNRALLHYQEGFFAEAAGDLSKVSNPDPELLEIRAESFLKSDQLQNARKDLEQLQSIKADTEVDQKLDEVNRKIDREERIKANADAQLRINPNNLSALKQKANASRKLGDYNSTIKASEALLRRDPKNVEAYAELMKAYREQSQTDKARAVYERAKVAGADTSRLKNLVPQRMIFIPRQIKLQ
jgi:tetratricopeptide (TPR) repeat protein